jgi:hypothetical protein
MKYETFGKDYSREGKKIIEKKKKTYVIVFG